MTIASTGASQSFSIALTSAPLGLVTVNLTNGDPTEGSLSTTSLTFSTLDWSTPKTVTVTGHDDHQVGAVEQAQGAGGDAGRLGDEVGPPLRVGEQFPDALEHVGADESGGVGEVGVDGAGRLPRGAVRVDL